jgi:hypothetical protein
MIARIQFSSGKSGEYKIINIFDDCDKIYDLIDNAYKNHNIMYAYKAFYDATTGTYIPKKSSLPCLINPAHVVLIEIIQEQE